MSDSPDLDHLDAAIRIAVYNLMLVLYEYGIEEIHMGGLMRILGVPNKLAQKHDDEVVVLDAEFAKYVRELTTTDVRDQVLH